MQLIEAIENVCNDFSKLFTKNKLDEKQKEAYNVLTDFYNIDQYSALIIALTFKEDLYGRKLKLDKLFKDLNLGLIEIVALKKTILNLQKKGWIIQSRSTSFNNFRTETKELRPGKVIIDATMKNDSTILLPEHIDNLVLILLNANEFIKGVIDTFNEDDLVDCYLSYMDSYRHHYYINDIIINSQINDIEKCIILWMSCEVVNGNNNFDLNEILNIFLDVGVALQYKEKFYDGSSNLLLEKFIECNKPHFMDLSDVRLGDKLYEKIDQLGLLKKKKHLTSKFMLHIKPEEIIEKKLYFNENSEKELSKITQMLEEDIFLKVMQRFEECQMQRAITMMLYGEPGVGKTEFVKQIAKKTHRDIYQVDISSIKNMWVGESEKNINMVFKQYANFMKQAKLTPILLFNEADALLNLRVNIGGSVDQMMNSMQNILLQNLEDFNGIFIATTNLVDNIDGAFDRRLVYKHKFDLPDTQTKIKILADQFPEINLENITKFGKEYNLTGGQIQNIKKKLSTDYILFDKDINALDNIEQYIKDEVYFREEQKQKIGF
jgi:AAA+ superfamily predicted ATPase